MTVTKVEYDPSEDKTYCTICSNELHGVVMDNPIYERGELEYIELAHLECAKEAQWNCNKEPGLWLRGRPIRRS